MGLYNYFQEAGVTVGALVYDGLHAEMSKSHPIHLTEAPKFIKKETGFDVTLFNTQFGPGTRDREIRPDPNRIEE
jgi:hypothetical protein